MLKYLKETIDAVCESVRFDSSYTAPQAGMPFGKGAADCLAHFLSLARRLGFETRNYDNYVGEVLFGEGTPFAVLAHLDVVPAGGGWTRDPFGGKIEDGKIYGRGTMDDKGPAIAALFALKTLKDEGFRPHREIRLIVGCNEESGWACIDHYRKVADMPEEGFSPDANFPVIYAEKGILHVNVRFPVENAPFRSFTGGERVNMVCDFCQSTPYRPDAEKAERCGLRLENGVLLSYGKSAHGSTPELGKNAILPMLRYYDDNEAIRRVVSCLFDDEYGLKRLRDETGALTLSPNVIDYGNDTLSLLCDVRYPATMSEADVTRILDRFGVPYETVGRQAPVFNDPNGPLVSTLCDVYNDITGKRERPIAIGGGTYARALKCGAAFGPEIEGEEATIHQADEYITIERIGLMLRVYTEALRRLTK